MSSVDLSVHDIKKEKKNYTVIFNNKDFKLLKTIDYINKHHLCLYIDSPNTNYFFKTAYFVTNIWLTHT